LITRYNQALGIPSSLYRIFILGKRDRRAAGRITFR
jgi:hypothetical protein